MKPKTFTPTQIKADIQLVIAVGLALGLNIPTALSVGLIGASAVICVGLNLAEAHIHVGKGLAITIDKALAEIKGILPAVNQLAAALPGQVGVEVKKVLELIEKAPAEDSAKKAPKA